MGGGRAGLLHLRRDGMGLGGDGHVRWMLMDIKDELFKEDTDALNQRRTTFEGSIRFLRDVSSMLTARLPPRDTTITAVAVEFLRRWGLVRDYVSRLN